MTKSIVGLSGGVDSAVAALLLVEQGLEVQGLFMSNWDEDGCLLHPGAGLSGRARRGAGAGHSRCIGRTSPPSIARRVFEYFLAEHRAGRTPNPDVLCNREVKFGVALRHARRLGASRFATGHYARLRHGRRRAAAEGGGCR